ncbi:MULTISPECIES: hypothetical protein [Metallosphaera]|uniref:Uncharacterized protein n=3 Tax=Metallosphaera TaxID=41980 RepID=A4YGD7_METS5|nr:MULTISPECIES: hypothetical protein [Metallosphaera]ABP95489.1 hypothetical protein Msed_1331 [Metallosphaera sedula DSM 5348]AIM27474.1 hypothetical protein HA72_1331 [Metallosphaera sedula]AKV74344.1 hypothetical protein MsedA_1349 [Metallosphaera sedula]AKV76583.1 hypothetical protein MsedB_1351 [Metallosphaera sedula]AKV78835.1 hypothetical protein MsedC_1349 [Metallosphaera sedula]
MPYFLGYEVFTNASNPIYIFYIFNFTNHSVLISTVNPVTHTILNYTSAIPSFLLVTSVNGTPVSFHLQGLSIPAFEVMRNGIYIYSTKGVLLEQVNNNGNMTLIYANFPGLTSQSLPSLHGLAGNIVLFPVNIITLLGIVLSLQLFLILKKVIR